MSLTHNMAIQTCVGWLNVCNRIIEYFDNAHSFLKIKTEVVLFCPGFVADVCVFVWLCYVKRVNLHLLDMLLDTQVCFRKPAVYTYCTTLDNAEHHILGTQQCKTIMTLSDHKGKQIIRNTIQKRFQQDFRTMFITHRTRGAHYTKFVV
jgi:hypothetical protein